MPTKQWQRFTVQPVDRVTLYIPQRFQGLQIIARVEQIATERDRSRSYIILEALLEYLVKYEESGTLRHPSEQ